MASTLIESPSTAPVERRERRWPASPAIGRAELLWAILAAVLLAVLTSWPLVLHMSTHIAPDLGDPVRTAWEIAWVGHAMLHDPRHLFDSNAFYPHPLSLAFSDSLLGYGPAAFFGSGTVAALVRYNLLFLWAWSLCFVGAYLLARELGLRWYAAAAAGVAFAYAPYRVTEAGHLHVISSGGFVLAMFLLLRGYRRGSRGLVLAGWLVSAWQVSLGFTLGLQYTYLLLVLGLLVLWRWWRGRLTPGPAWEDSEARASSSESATAAPSEDPDASLPACRCPPSARAADPPPPARRHADRDRRARRRRRLPGTALPEGRPGVPDGQAHAERSRELLIRPRRAAVGLLGEPRLGQRDLRDARESALQERGRLLARRRDPAAGDRRPLRRASTRAVCGSACSRGSSSARCSRWAWD